MKKLIKAIVITGMCISSVSSVSSAFCLEDEPVSVGLACTYCSLLSGQRHALERVKLTRERLTKLRIKVNSATKCKIKLTSEEILHRLQTKGGYIYFELAFWESETGNYETYILGSNQSRLDDHIFIFNLKE
jgi:hypothetical protein